MSIHPEMLDCAEAACIAVMESVVSFLRTEEIRGMEIATAHLERVGSTLRSPAVSGKIGMALVDSILCRCSVPIPVLLWTPAGDR